MSALFEAVNHGLEDADLNLGNNIFDNKELST
jgi:hypothetical protein